MIDNDYQEIKYNQPKKWIQYLIISSCSVIGLGLILSIALRIDEVITLIGDLGLQCWHAGSIENSAAAEALTSVLISINQKHKLKSSGIKITSR